MQVVILAGGFGTRLSEYTSEIPKPMVKIGGKPILFHIMSHYASYGFRDFIVLLGYKSEVVIDYFSNLKLRGSDISIDFTSGEIQIHNSIDIDWKVTLVNSGEESMTGGRLLYAKKYLADSRFMLTYGDGLSDINVTNLLDFHYSHKKMATVTAVRPVARFGELEIVDNSCMVKSFTEKPHASQGWINGGFFVFENEFIGEIDNHLTVLEQKPMESVAQSENLVAYLHDGFWQCMDTKRDLDYLNSIYSKGPPWNIKR